MVHLVNSFFTWALVLSTPAALGAITGQWDFDSGDLRATAGAPMEFLDGPGGATARGTEFNTTTKFAIPDIGRTAAKVLRFPRMESTNMGYLVPHGSPPNGDGTRVNQYTVIMDVYFPGSSSGAFRSLFQADNEGEAEFYLNPANAVGVSGDYAGEVTPDAWHRVAFAVDVSGRAPTVLKYVDGVKADRQRLTQGRDGRWSLGANLMLFQDPAGDSRAGYLNSLQIRDRVLNEGELSLLGPATAGGIPTNDQPAWPYVEKTEPAPGVYGIAPDTDIRVEILDGENTLDGRSIRLVFNHRTVTPDVSKAGNRTLVRYRPEAGLNQNTNRVVLIHGAGGRTWTNAWHFVTTAVEQGRGIAGQWDFKKGDLSATIGRPLQYMDGARGASSRAVEFKSTREFGIADVDGKPAQVLRFGGATGRNIGLVMDHGILPNGAPGVTRANQWTLIVDLLIPNAYSERWLAVLQTDLSNTSDTDFCISMMNQTGGMGIRGQYAGEGAIVAGRWHRIAVAMNVAGEVMEKYIDGELFAVQQLPEAEADIDGRFSLASSALLFADEDGESQAAYVNSIQIRNYAMDADEVRALGAPSAQGISTNFVRLTDK